MELKTIAKLAKVAKLSLDSHQGAEQGEVTGPVPLTAVQKWFLEKADCGQVKNMQHFNQAYLLKCNERISVEKLTGAVNKLVAYHDMLRARFAKDDETGSWAQTILSAADAGIAPFVSLLPLAPRRQLQK